MRPNQTNQPAGDARVLRIIEIFLFSALILILAYQVFTYKHSYFFPPHEDAKSTTEKQFQQVNN